MKSLFISILVSVFTTMHICAQENHSMHMNNHSMQMNDTIPHNMNDMKHDAHHMPGMQMSMGNMSHSFSLNVPMSRNGSGTSWSPDAAPMYGQMYH